MISGVADARDWANALIQRETRGSGDTENAMRRLENRYGIPWRVFWTLRYRPPTEIFHSTYLRLAAAYQSECDRQMRLLKHEATITALKVGAAHPAVASAQAVVGEEVE